MIGIENQLTFDWPLKTGFTVVVVVVEVVVVVVVTITFIIIKWAST